MTPHPVHFPLGCKYNKPFLLPIYLMLNALFIIVMFYKRWKLLRQLVVDERAKSQSLSGNVEVRLTCQTGRRQMSEISPAPRSPCPRCLWLLLENGNGDSGVESCHDAGPLKQFKPRQAQQGSNS